MKSENDPISDSGRLLEHALARIAKGDGLFLKSVAKQAYRRSHALPPTARLSPSMTDFSRYDQALSLNSSHIRFALAPLDETITIAELTRDPYPIYRRLRREAPVLRVKSVGRTFLTKAADTKYVKDNAALFSSDDPNTPMKRAFLAHTVMRKDHDEHRTERMAMMPALMPKTIESVWAPRNATMVADADRRRRQFRLDAGAFRCDRHRQRGDGQIYPRQRRTPAGRTGF